MEITINKSIKAICPELHLGIIKCVILNKEYDIELWNEIKEEENQIISQLKTEHIKSIPIIGATRIAYKKCGKDPNRYRPSSEALLRRIISGKELYQINSAVDVINLISFKTGYCIGAFDADKINGNLTYGIGEKDEIYKGIGRGPLNIEGLPILRDTAGGIGTPTSDEERTKLNIRTTNMLVNINGYLGKEELKEVMELTIEKLKLYLKASNVTSQIVR